MPLPYNPTQVDGRTVAETNENRVLLAVRHFGHLRRQEIAMAVWPKSSPRSAYIMACRTVGRLVKSGHLLERQNTLGGMSFVLSAKGVARLRDLDVDAQEGYELAYDGPQFYHRTLGTCYLLEKARSGCEVYGEFAILKNKAPVKREFARAMFKKVPDGLVVYSAEALGLREGFRAADWVEVESAFKPYEEIEKALALLTGTAVLNKDGTLMLNKLVFVYDSRQRHDRRILRYILRFLKAHPDVREEAITNEVVIARCLVDAPFTWHGVEESTAKQLLDSSSLDTGDDNEEDA